MTDKEQQWVTEDGMGLLGRQNSGSAEQTAKQRLLVVGNGMVGHHFVEQLVAAGGLEQFDVTVFGAEPGRRHDRVHLSEVFGGKAPQALRMAARLPGMKRAALRAAAGGRGGGARPGGPHPDAGQRRAVSLYDRLVLATGSVPFVPPSPAISGRAASSTVPWEISPPSRDACAQARSGVVIGGGLLGLEAANALRLLGLKTQVVGSPPG